MATIQIRDIPDEAYEVIRRRARVAGQSIQAYMRQQVIEAASRPDKAEALERIRASLARAGSPAPSTDEIVRAVHAGRRPA